MTEKQSRQEEKKNILYLVHKRLRFCFFFVPLIGGKPIKLVEMKVEDDDEEEKEVNKRHNNYTMLSVCLSLDWSKYFVK